MPTHRRTKRSSDGKALAIIIGGLISVSMMYFGFSLLILESLYKMGIRTEPLKGIVLAILSTIVIYGALVVFTSMGQYSLDHSQKEESSESRKR